MERYTLKELKYNKANWEEAVVVFTQDSFNREFTKKERSYKIKSDSKFFDENMIGTSLFGDCLDDFDKGVRLDHYIHTGDDKKWVVDYCYILKKCPSCNVNYLGEEGSNALSRKDNDTEICSDCGTVEAIDSMVEHGKEIPSKPSNIAVTLRELRDKLNLLSDEQLDLDITILQDDEYLKVNVALSTEDDTDVLDVNHPFFEISETVKHYLKGGI